MPSNHLVLLSSPSPASVFPRCRVFSNESTLCIRWPKVWSFSLSTSPSNEYSGLISFRIDWLDLPAVQGTLKSLLQHHSSKASILWRSAFFKCTRKPQNSGDWLYCDICFVLIAWTWTWNISQVSCLSVLHFVYPFIHLGLLSSFGYPILSWISWRLLKSQRRRNCRCPGKSRNFSQMASLGLFLHLVMM